MGHLDMTGRASKSLTAVSVHRNSLYYILVSIILLSHPINEYTVLKGVIQSMRLI